MRKCSRIRITENSHLGRQIVILWSQIVFYSFSVSSLITVQWNLRPQNWWFTSQNDSFEFNYPLIVWPLVSLRWFQRGVCFYEEIWKIIHKLDYQVSICSLISPATAISKTQDRADMRVWWKLSFSIYFIIYYVQSAIINKVCKPELWFLYSAHPIIVLNICMKFHENISNDF